MDKKCCFLTCFVNLSRVNLPVARGHFTCAECTKKPFFNAKNRFSTPKTVFWPFLAVALNFHETLLANTVKIVKNTTNGINLPRQARDRRKESVGKTCCFKHLL
jgi:hypothetical protein